MSAAVQNIRLATDARIATGRSGIATYSRALRQAQLTLSTDVSLLDAHIDQTSLARPRRWARALVPAGVHLATDKGVIIGNDVFRLAISWFDVHRRLLPLYVDGPVGIIHWSHPVPLRLVGWKNVYTIHDTIPLSSPELSRIPMSRYRRLLASIDKETKRGGAITTVSEAAKADLVDQANIDPAQIEVTGQSVLRALSDDTPLPDGLRADGYVLACGSVEARKNCLRLAEAHRRSGISLPLVFAGPAVGGQEDIERQLTQYPNVIRLSDLTEPQMTTLLARANSLAMMSLAEGFGLPVIEAMALGTPVLGSSISAIMEVAGGAALLASPYDIDLLSRDLVRITSDEALRAKLTAAGFSNAERFTPQIFADKLSSLYRRLIAETC